MRFDALRSAKFTALGEAVDAWSTLVGKLDKLSTEADGQLDGKSRSADWKGVNATVTQPFITKTAGEFADAVTEATTIRNILRDTHEELVDWQKKLVAAVADAEKDDLTVSEFEDGAIVEWNGSVPGLVDGQRLAPSATTDAAMKDITARLTTILSGATHSDTSAADVLSLLVGQDPVGFSAASYKDRDSAAAAMDAAKKDAALMKKGDKMTPAQFDALLASLGSHKNDPLFQEELATTLGPKGVLDFWADMSDPVDGDGLQAARQGKLGDLQQDLSMVLAGATQSQSPAMQGWEQQMIDLGPKTVGTQYTEPTGFQLMSNLMRAGHYNGTFLQNYGNALVANDEKVGVRGYGNTTMPMNFLDVKDGGLGRDPVTGFMDALAVNPDAATQFFDSTEPRDNAKYLLEQRGVFDDSPGDSGNPNESRTAVGKALFAATSGIPADDPGMGYQPHTVQQTELFKKSLSYLADTGPGFPPEMRDSTARMIGNYGDLAERTMGAPRTGPTPLDPDALFQVSKEISRDEHSYALLNSQMNAAVVQDIHTETAHPEDSLHRAGRTVGFLEESRYQAIDDHESVRMNDVNWKRLLSYDLVGAVITTPLGKLGDPVQRAWDVTTSSWAMDQQNAAAGVAADQSKQAYLTASNRLGKLSDIWYAQNSGWAQEPAHEGFSQKDGAPSEIAGAANDGQDNAHQRLGQQ